MYVHKLTSVTRQLLLLLQYVITALWFVRNLYQLKRAVITQKDLASVYVSVVRPVTLVCHTGHAYSRTVLEYACPVWHTNLPQYLSDNIGVIQKGH